MAPNAKVKVEFELTAEQRKLLGMVVAMEKVSEGEVCRRLIVNFINGCRDAAITGVLPRLPHEPKPLPPPKPAGRRPPAPKVVRGPDQYHIGP